MKLIIDRLNKVKSKYYLKNRMLLIVMLVTCAGYSQSKNIGKQIQNSKTTNNNPLHPNGIFFTQNNGQIIDIRKHLHPEILFKSDVGGANIYLRKTGISFVINNTGQIFSEAIEHDGDSENGHSSDPATEQIMKQEFLSKQIIKTHRIDVDFDGSNTDPTIISSEQIAGYNNYYLAHCPDGILKVPSYNQITAKNIYNNIDVKYQGGKDASASITAGFGLKYDIIVNPGGDPSQIKLKYSGAEKLTLINGHLSISTSLGIMGEYIPKVYQNINGKIFDIKTEYKLTASESTGSEAIVSFKLGNWDPEFPLIIDPWITYYGGSDFETSSSVTVDPTGNVLFSGTTRSIDFPVSVGAFQNSFNGGLSDIFVVKMNAAGNLIWATFCGGSLDDNAGGICTDATGNILFTGNTVSTDFPTGSSGVNVVHQNIFGGGGGANRDAIVFKLNSAGARLFSTFYGGSLDDAGGDIVSDGSNFYLGGMTISTNGISTPGSFQPALSASNDAFLVKFNSTGNRLWGSYLGGTAVDYCNGVACDALGNVFIGGCTHSTNFPVGFSGVNVVHQAVFGGNKDAFICKFDPAGIRLWGTYYGGTGSDGCYAIAVDGLNNIFIAGDSNSATAIATPGAFQTALAGIDNVLLVKFNSTGTRQWGTYYGGNNNQTYCTGLACDVSNNVILGGDTYSSNNSVTGCAYQTIKKGSEDQFIATFSSTGTRVCSGYLGMGGAASPHNETSFYLSGGSIAVDGCFMYLVSYTQCNYPVTAGAWQTTCGGYADAALSKLYINTCGGISSSLSMSVAPASICKGQSTNFTSIYTACSIGTVNYSWSFPGGTPSGSTAQNPSGIVYNTPGVYDAKLVIQMPCGKDSVIKQSTIIVNDCACTLLAPVSGVTNTICNGGSNGTATTAGSGGTGPYTYSWSNGQTTSTASGLTAGTYQATISDAGGCTIMTQVTITQPALITFQTQSTSGPTLCYGAKNGSATISAISGGTTPYTYSWSNGQSAITATGLSAGTYTITVADNKGCSAIQTALVGQQKPVISTITSTPATCGSKDGTAAAIFSTTTISYSWSPSGGNGSFATSTTATGLSAGTYTLTATSFGGCIASATTTITSSNGPVINTTQTNINCGGTGSATVVVTSGSGPYTYSWTNGQKVQTATGLSAGNYTVSVTDGSGCISSSSVIIIEAPPLILNYISNNPTCGQVTTFFTANASGGTPLYTYSWTGFSVGATPFVNGPTIDNTNANNGCYLLEVTDQFGCQAGPIGLCLGKPTTTISIGSLTTLNPVCNNNTGSATITSSGTSPYTYQWNNGQTTQTATGLSAGNYTITVTDANGCSATSVTSIISPPALTGFYSKGTANCNNCGCKEWLVVTGSGGTSPYSYSWPDGYAMRYKNLLCPGAYTINIKDKNGCSINVNLTTP